MERPQRNAADIAKAIRSWRAMTKMKAETLAELASVDVRSIERAESGRHVPSEDTLGRIAKAFGADLSMFDPFDEEALRREVEERSKKTLLVPTNPLKNPADMMAAMGGTLAFHHDVSAIANNQALTEAVSLVDSIRDWGEIWEDLSVTEQLAGCECFVEKANLLRGLGYGVSIGTYHALERMPTAKPWKIKVLLITFLPNEHPGRYAMITLSGRMETLPEDRLTIPGGPQPDGFSSKAAS